MVLANNDITELQRERFKRQSTLSVEELLLCALYDVRTNTVTDTNSPATAIVMLIATEDSNNERYVAQCTGAEFVAYSHLLLDSALDNLKNG